MDMMTLILIIILILAIIFIVYTFIHLYNNLVGLRNRVENSYSQIEVQLKRRNDLIPNLVETVKGYAAHEKEVFENVTQARSNVMNATGVDETSAADNQLTGALKSLFAIAENYPELKANSNFQQLQTELSETEYKIFLTSVTSLSRVALITDQMRNSVSPINVRTIWLVAIC
jgi:LemA protein